jgi:hypothetical protein
VQAQKVVNATIGVGSAICGYSFDQLDSIATPFNTSH